MKLIKILLFSILFVSICNSVNAQSDCLEPVEGTFESSGSHFEYHLKIRKILFEDLPISTDLTFLTLPSFKPENVLIIEDDKKSQKKFLVYHAASENIWFQKSEVNVVKKIKKEISIESAILMKKLFESAILKTKYSTEEGKRSDGTDYYFSYDDYGSKSGKVWSPKKETNMFTLVEIANDVINLVKSEKDKIEFNDELNLKIKNLLDKINNGG